MAFSFINKLNDAVAKVGNSIPKAASTPQTTATPQTTTTPKEVDQNKVESPKLQFHEVFIHPDDKIASDKFKALPLFDTVVSKFMDSGLDQAIHMHNMTSFMRISSNQLPTLYERTVNICTKLKIDVPELFLDLSSDTPAHASGLKQTTLVFGKSLLEYQDDANVLDTVIAHECGHIFCRNCMYRTFVTYFDAFGGKFGDLLGGALTPIKMAMNYWYRKSELSADRVAATVCGSANTVIEAQLNLANTSKWLVNNANIEAWANQIDEIKSDASATEGIVQNILAITNKHTISALRVRELLKWGKTDNFTQIKAKLDSGDFDF